MDDTIDHVINAAESTGVDFTVAGLGHGAIGTVTLTDAADHHAIDVTGNGSETAGLTDGTIRSSLRASDGAGDTTTATGNSVLLDTDKGPSPTLSVNAVNPTYVPAGETLELASPYSGNLLFAGATGTLKIDHSSSFSGTIGGQLAIGDVIDLADITAGASAKISYSGNNSPGTLTVSDGTHTASIALLGNYSLANFTASSDGHGGTSVVDPPSTTWNVSSASQLSDALSHASAGDQIVLASGNYGAFTFDNNYSNYVTVRSATPGGAVFSQLNVLNSSFLRIDGVHVQQPTSGNPWDKLVDIENSHNVDFINSEVNGPAGIYNGYYGIYSLSNDQININNNNVHNVNNGILLFGTTNVTAANNYIDYTGNNCFKFGGINNFVIQNNTGGGHAFPLAGDHLDFIQGQGASSNGVISGNVMLAQNIGGASLQGIFLADGAYTNVTIEENIIYTGMVCGIQIEGSSNIIRNNTLLNVPGVIQDATTYLDINNNSVVSGNITSGQAFDGQITANQIVTQHADPTKPVYYNTLFANAGKGFGITLADLMPVAGSAADFPSGMGADQRLHDLLFGTGTPAPVITSFSPDSGTVGDGITHATALTLTGTAVANSSVTVFDGTNKVGTATADANGKWTVTTSALSDGTHNLAATDSNSSGTSAASAALSVTVDTKAPAAPVLISDPVVNTNHVQLSGTAEANSTITVFDGTAVVGTGTTSSTGSWSITTTALGSGAHALTATATDAAGNVSVASQPLDPVIPAPTTPTPPAAPKIVLFSPDSGVAGDHTTNDNTPILSGTAVANSTVTVFDGMTKVGTVTADSSGNWTLTTSALSDGTHSLTATDSNSSGISAASAALSVTVDTKAPAAPVLISDPVVNTNHVQLSGTAEANSTITVFDGTAVVGTGTTSSTGSWSITTTALGSGGHALTATATDAAGNVSVASQPLDPVIPAPTTPTPPAAPKIVLFSPDSGVAGDHITNDNTLTLGGTAAANSTVSVFDGTGTTPIATINADGSGQWTVTTPALSNGAHNLTATSTNSSGQTSAASAALAVTIDTVAPAAPVVTSDSVVNTNHVLASGTAAANSTIAVYDGNTVLGTVAADASGNWSVTTSALSSGTHALVAKATDAAGNVSAGSQPFDPVIGGGSTTPPTTTPSGSTGLVQVGNNYFLGSSTGPELKYHSAAVTTGQFQDWIPISSVQVDGGGYDVAWKNASGQFTFWATDSQGNFQSYPTNGVALAGNSTTVKSYETIFHQDLNGDHTIGILGAPPPTTPSGSTGLVQVGNNYFLGGTGPELKYHGAAVTTGQFQDWIPISSVQVDGGGYDVAWKNASGQFTFWATDSQGNFQSYPTHGVALAGNSTTVEAYETIFHQDLNGDHTIGVPGATVTPTTPTPTVPASAVNFSSLTESSSNVVTIQGAADAFSQVRMYDGKAYIGTTTAGADGTWSFTSSSALSNTVHTFNAVEVDSAGHTTASSGSAILGSIGANTLTSTSGNDLFVGNGHPDTFVFASNFGQDVIKDFAAGSRGHDTIQFSKSEFDSFASVLSHASQVGQDVVISAGNNSLTLKNTKIGALNSHDFHFA